MKISKNERQGNSANIEVETGYDELKPHIDHAFKEAAKEVKVPGFRPGKVPVDMIKTYLNEEVVVEKALQELIADLYPKIIQEAKIEPVGYPNVEVITIEKDKPVAFRIKVDVYPDVKIGKYKTIKVNQPSTEVTQKEIDDTIEAIRMNLAVTNVITDRGIRDKDIATLDIRAECEGKTVPQFTRKSVNIEVGRAQISVEFDTQLINMKTGEARQFTLSMPAGFYIPQIAGKNVDFNLTIKEIKERALPPLNDDFAKTVSKSSTLEAMKEEIKSHLTGEKKSYAEQAVRDAAVEKAAELVEADISKSMVDREVDLTLEDFDRRLRRNGSDLQTYLRSMKKDIEALKEEVKDTSTKRVKAKLFLRKIIEDEKIKVLDNELEKELEEMAKASGKSASDVKKEIGEDGIDAVKDFLLRKKAVDHLVANIKIEKERR